MELDRVALDLPKHGALPVDPALADRLEFPGRFEHQLVPLRASRKRLCARLSRCRAGARQSQDAAPKRVRVPLLTHPRFSSSIASTSPLSPLARKATHARHLLRRLHAAYRFLSRPIRAEPGGCAAGERLAGHPGCALGGAGGWGVAQAVGDYCGAWAG